jgi:foldase protein PrsA
MKHVKSFVLCFLVFSGLAGREVVDKILARVGGSLILLSDLALPRIGAASYNLDQLIRNEVFFQEALRKKLVPSDTEVEKQVVSYKERNNLTRLSGEEFEEHLKIHRFTLAGYKKELARYIATQNLFHQQVKDRIFITSQEVERYYNEHPETVETRYKLKTAIVPFSQAQTIEEAKLLKKIDWIEAEEWIDDSQLSDMISFVKKMKKGEVSEPVKTEYGFQFVLLIDKQPAHIKELKARYGEIEEILRDQKMQLFEDDYFKELKEHANIVIFPQADHTIVKKR